MVAKSDKMVSAPNLGEPKTMKRSMLNGVVQTVVTYGAPAWYRVIRVEKYRNKRTEKDVVESDECV